MAHPYWPPFDLVVRTPMIELRLPTDDELVALVEVAQRGVHPPGFMPFEVPWTEQPSPAMEREFLKYHWRTRAEWTPEWWRYEAAVFHEGSVVGAQAMVAHEFSSARAVKTGSWLGMDHQGRGIGKEMRSAMLHLAFAGLGAQAAYSAAWEDNVQSIGVSRSVGYEDNGDEIKARKGEAVRQIGFKVTRDRWEQRRRPDIEIENLEPCLEWFGAAASDT